MVTWAFRQHRWMFIAFFVLNTLMIASTVLLGPHYAVDIIASIIVFAASAWLYSRWGRQLAATSYRTAQVAPAVHAAAR